MKKISLKDLKNGLRRDEMRSIQGGGCGGQSCGSDSGCQGGCRTTQTGGSSSWCSSCCVA